MKKFHLAAGTVAVLLAAASCFGAETAVKGDVDQNGCIDANDSAYVLQYVLASNKMDFSSEQLWAAEVDGVDGLSADDAAFILQKALVSTFEFPEKYEETTEESTEATTEETTEIMTEETTEVTTEKNTEVTTEEITETTTEETTEATTEEITETTTKETTETATEETTEVTTEETTAEAADTSDGVVVASFSELTAAINKGEKKIYIKGEINCPQQLSLKTADAGIELYGLKNDDGTGAVLNFKEYRDSLSSSGESGTGIYIKGSGYSFTNLIIENAGDCGVRIKSDAGGNCTFKNCVFRYNNNSGVSVTSGGHDNTFICCDSYRNGDIVQKSGADADGYSIKLAAGGGNKFYNCRAWENADDGWDSYDRGAVVPDVEYVECLAWHNGNPDTFTGEYDYNNGYALDKNLVYVQAILESDPDFETKYNAHEVTTWPNVTMRLLGTTNNYTKLYKNWGGNPNGFKFGSSASTADGYRYIENCIAFDHYGNASASVQWRAKGFDQNCDSGSGGIHFDLKNILSFNNVENVQMVKMNADSISGVVWSFENCADPNGTMYPDEPSEGMTITVPENKDELKQKVYAYRDMIYSYVYNDKIPGEQICDVFE